MEALLVLVPFAASLLTFFSGFGLGTLLTPVFVLFFPVDLALLMTASVHLMNNVFKFGLLIRSVERKTLFSFALWAVPGAFIGARATVGLGQMSAWHFGSLDGRSASLSDRLRDDHFYPYGILARLEPLCVDGPLVLCRRILQWFLWRAERASGSAAQPVSQEARSVAHVICGHRNGHRSAHRSEPNSNLLAGFWYGGLAMETRTSRFCLGHLWCSVGQAYVEEGPVGTDAAAGRPLPALDGHRTDVEKSVELCRGQ